MQEIVPLRKVCRRPETEYRLRILHATKAEAQGDISPAAVNQATAQNLEKMPDTQMTETPTVPHSSAPAADSTAASDSGLSEGHADPTSSQLPPL